MKFLKFIPFTIIVTVLALLVYLAVYQFKNIDMTPARVVINRWPAIAILLLLVGIFPYAERHTTSKRNNGRKRQSP